MQIMTSLRIIRGRGLLIATIIIHICILQLHYITEKAVWVGVSGGTNSNNTTNINGQTSTSSTTFEYIPAPVENLIVKSAETLGFTSQNNPSGCDIWKANTTHNEIYDALSSYAKDLAEYNKAVANFQPIPDVFKSIKKGDYSVCDATRIHNDGVRGLFPSNQLSLTKNGYIEPLAPPFRSNVFCTDKRHLLSLDYLVHDFEQMCRNLKPTSRRVLIDMGAALNFHGGGGVMLRLLQQYEKFGFHFDHYYAFEVAFTEPKKVYEELLRKEYLPIYHWINTGVSHEEGSKLNPLESILKSFDEDDFVVIKLDIDTGSIELPLVKQLLEGGENGIYHKLVDQFYFEHHVHMREIAMNWKSTMQGTIKDSLDMFYGLREKGIAAHFWP